MFSGTFSKTGTEEILLPPVEKLFQVHKQKQQKKEKIMCNFK